MWRVSRMAVLLAAMSKESKGETVKPRLLSVVEAARYIGVSRATMHRMIDLGIVPHVRVTPGRKHLDRADLDAHIERSRIVATDAPRAVG